jgi:chemotaxis protein methyltransferase CheR
VSGLATPSEQWLPAFTALVEERFGHTIPKRRATAFWRSVLEACLASGETSLERYYLRLSTGPLDAPAVTELVSRITIKESYFFRDENLITVLRERLLPALIERSGGKNLTIWSAGCSLGEEAYTLAILLHELAPLHQGLDFSIVATDVDEIGLNKARAAEYGEWSVRSLGADERERYFERRGTRFVLRPRWRRNVRFETQNLVDPSAPPPAPGAFDLVICRNVAIYFGEQALDLMSHKLGAAVGHSGLVLLAPSDPRPSDGSQLAPLIVRHRGRAAVGYARPGSSWYATYTSHGRQEARYDLPAPVVSLPAPPESVTVEPAPPARRASSVPPAPALDVAAEVSARVEAAYAEASRGNVDAAIKVARSAIELAPLQAEPYFALALIELESGRHAEAETEFRRVLYLAPQLADAHYRLGLLCLRRDVVAAARRAFFNALRADETQGSLLAGAIGAQLAQLERLR